MTFFLNGTPVGSGSVSGSLKLDLHTTRNSIKLGSTVSTSTVFEGTLDEVRLSQMLRYTGAFTPATSAFSAD